MSEKMPSGREQAMKAKKQAIEKRTFISEVAFKRVEKRVKKFKHSLSRREGATLQMPN